MTFLGTEGVDNCNLFCGGDGFSVGNLVGILGGKLIVDSWHMEKFLSLVVTIF